MIYCDIVKIVQWSFHVLWHLSHCVTWVLTYMVLGQHERLAGVRTHAGSMLWFCGGWTCRWVLSFNPLRPEQNGQHHAGGVFNNFFQYCILIESEFTEDQCCGCVGDWDTDGFWHLINWDLNKMAEILQQTVSGTFSLIKVIVYIFKFYWRLLLRVQLTIIQSWSRSWLGS